MTRRAAIAVFCLANVFATTSQALAWNSLGHKVIAEIAWQQLAPIERQTIVDTLKRHPRFAEDFVKKMPADVASADHETQDRWIFWQAAVWPDIARGGPYDRPLWHYVDRPTFLGPPRRVAVNLSTDYPTSIPVEDYNCIQAAKYSLGVLKDNATSPGAKALAYCWLFHLAGDMHQPMHSTALFCDFFPAGDKGGNDVPLARGRNLHALWDGLLGNDDRLSNVLRETDHLRQNSRLWTVDTNASIESWIAESHELAESFAYAPVILDAVKSTQPGNRLSPITLSDEYLRTAGARARQRVVAAGLRLAAVLNSL